MLGVLSWPLAALSKYIPDPFFVNGRKASSALADLARLHVTKRVITEGGLRDDILGRLIDSFQPDDILAPGCESFETLVAECVTLL